MVTADEEQGRRVHVSGTSISRVKPDTVVWSIYLQHKNPDLQQARDDSNAATRSILGMREDLGVGAKDMQTGYLSINRVYQRDRSGNEGEFRHYNMSRSITIRQKDLSKFDDTLEKLTGLNDIRVSYSLESSDYHQIRRETRLNAVKIAKEKAKEMVELLDAKLGAVKVIDETTPSTVSPYGRASNFSNSISVAGEAASPDDIEGTMSPGAVEIRVSVDVVFAIE